ncbi:Ger(x)C family spore germination protein [Halobacillus sp. Nhm2S1]|uniref:Ger(x)C family spore germination protein n=1 Tax=Halobacillus sp. Nhm2S1 TaxID=2866716 RepID=UPI001C7354D1|nr:Ger(x)C family spore germination protein [Halobacillus sp. Nhm2S1]MBX0356116.1 Ger(x)C family spore germination protein [Halobacillus sp. Nhm2S1]
MPRKVFFTSWILLFVLTGCWDIKEIEDVGIVTGMGLDFNEETDELTMINQYVVPARIPTQQSSSQHQSDPYQNISQSGKTFFEIIRNNSLESNRPPNYTHLKSILASTALFEKERADQVIDLFIRDHEFRRTTPVYLTRGPVLDILNTEPAKELFPSIQIKSLSENFQKNNQNPTNLSIGDMSQLISEDKSFLIPGITLNEGNIKSSGAGIIEAESSNYVGWIDVEDMEGVRYIHNTVQGGFIYLDEEMVQEGPIILEIKGSKTKFQTKVTGDEPEMTLQIATSTVLAEDWGTGRDVYKAGWKKEIEEASNNVIQGKVERVLKIAQQEYRIDFLDISKWIQIHEPKYWKEHEKEWNEIFPDMNFNVEVTTEITDFGTQNFNTEE